MHNTEYYKQLTTFLWVLRAGELLKSARKEKGWSQKKKLPVSLNLRMALIEKHVRPINTKQTCCRPLSVAICVPTLARLKYHGATSPGCLRKC